MHVRSEAMPIREFPFGMNLKSEQLSNDRSWRIQALNGPALSDMVRKQRAIESSCCEVREMWKSFLNVQVSSFPLDLRLVVLQTYIGFISFLYLSRISVTFACWALYSDVLCLSFLWGAVSYGGNAPGTCRLPAMDEYVVNSDGEGWRKTDSQGELK